MTLLFKILGFVLIIFTTSAIGFLKANELNSRYKKLCDFSKSIGNLKEQDRIKEDPYYEAITNLDNTVFLSDFENYNPNSDEIKITESQAKKIAQKGFEESKNRIAAEGVDNIASEKIEIIGTAANNYFTRYYFEKNENYDNLRRKCYAITRRQSDLENGVTIYVDVTTGLIIGGMAFGD